MAEGEGGVREARVIKGIRWTSSSLALSLSPSASTATSSSSSSSKSTFGKACKLLSEMSKGPGVGGFLPSSLELEIVSDRECDEDEEREWSDKFEARRE